MNLSILTTIQDAAQDSVLSETVSTAYDSLWTGGDIPTQAASPLEQVMLADDKIFVVLAVVLIIWFGIIVLVLRTDNHIKSVERSVQMNIPEDEYEL